jgi:hypothetical protein
VGKTLNIFPIARNMPIMNTITAKKQRKLDPDFMKRKRPLNL